MLGLLMMALLLVVMILALFAKSPVTPSIWPWLAPAWVLGSFLHLSTAWLLQGRFFSANQREMQAMQETLRLNHAVCDSLAEPLLVTTLEGIVIKANSAASRVFGHPIEKLLGCDMAQLLLPARHQMEFAAFFGSLAGRTAGVKVTDAELQVMRSDGNEFAATFSIADLQVDNNRYFSILVRDATAQRQTLDSLRHNSLQLRLLIDTVPALIAYIDHTQRFQVHNTIYQETSGRSKAEIDGHTLLEVMGRETYAQIYPHINEVLAGYSISHECEYRLPSGEWRIYLMSYFPDYGNVDTETKVRGFFSLGTDVTELKRMDRMKSEFVSTVSHELRTPLTSIRGSLGLVWSGIAGALPEKAQALVGIAKNNCERLIRLINDILDSEKIESGKMRFEMQTLELEPLLEQSIADNEGMANQQQVRLVLRKKSASFRSQHLVRVNVDADRLMQVLANLLSNAIKFSPPGSEVETVIRSNGSRVRVEIRDHGPGIPEAFKKRIFQKFSQADSSDTRQKGGTGLGLSISRALIERMNGTIGFSTPGPGQPGTVFYFELPQWRETPAVTAPMGLHEVARPRVLVCEDDPDIARLIGMILDREGFDVDIAHTAAQAREHLQQERYAAMTVDIKLPYDNGLQLIHELRQQPRTAHLPVLVLSVSAEEARLHGDHHALSISDWLEKPLDEKRLVRCLKRAIQSSQNAQKSTDSFRAA